MTRSSARKQRQQQQKQLADALPSTASSSSSSTLVVNIAPSSLLAVELTAAQRLMGRWRYSLEQFARVCSIKQLAATLGKFGNLQSYGEAIIAEQPAFAVESGDAKRKTQPAVSVFSQMAPFTKHADDFRELMAAARRQALNGNRSRSMGTVVSIVNVRLYLDTQAVIVFCCRCSWSANAPKSSCRRSGS